jgi:hypothetical protein
LARDAAVLELLQSSRRHRGKLQLAKACQRKTRVGHVQSLLGGAGAFGIERRRFVVVIFATQRRWCCNAALQTRQSDAAWIGRADEGVPLGRILCSTDVATTVLFFLSSASAIVTGSITAF